MKIQSIEPISIRLPMKKPMKMARETVATADNLLVRVVLGDGTTGWGEGASAPSMTGETPEGMLAAGRIVARSLEGSEADDLDAVERAIDGAIYGNAGAKGAVEMAILDAVARRAGKPLAEFLGGRRRSRIPALWMLGNGTTAADVEEARARKAQGFVAYKIKVGVNDPDYDAARTREILAALGPGNLVSADANQGWSTAQAVRYVQAVEGCGLDFLEQPVPAGDLAAMAEVARASRIRIGADEALHGIDDLRAHHAAGAIHGGSLKVIKFGGVRAVLRAGALCESLGLAVNLACKIAESSVGTAAVLHLAAALPSVGWGVSLSSQYLADDIATAPPAITDGHAAVPEGPGLGIAVDEAKVARYRVSA